MHHTLKIADVYMEAKLEGDKPFEIRFNDRGFQKGDTVTYTTDRPSPMKHGGTWEITYVSSFEQKPNWVVFGDRLLKEQDDAR